MFTKAQIANLALHRIGVSQLIADVDTEQSQAAVSMRAIWDLERDFVLRDFAWPFATAYAELGLVEGSTDEPVNADWTFAYRYPSDCLTARRILTAAGRSERTPPPFRIGRDSAGRLIYTSQEEAELEYTFRVEEPSEFDAAFVSMLAWRLAASVAPSMGRLKDIVTLALQAYLVEKTVAQGHAANEGQEPEGPEAPWVSGR